MSIKLEGKKFSEFVAGLNSLSDDELQNEKFPGKNGALDGSKVRAVNNTDDYVYAITDSAERFIFGIKADGTIEYSKGFPQIQSLINSCVKSENGKSLILKEFADGVSSADEDFLQIVSDSFGRILETIENDGIHKFYKGVEIDGDFRISNAAKKSFADVVKDCDVGGNGKDWSEARNLKIDEPNIAFVNFTNIGSMPSTKTANAHAILEFYDGDGNYFKKKVIANAQGASSISQPKKNIAIDLCNDDWIAKDTFKIQFGSWVRQDSFHLKAYYGDFICGTGAVAYKIYDLIAKHDGIMNDAPWKKHFLKNVVASKGVCVNQPSEYSLRINDARCHQDGFPCIVFLNGVFYGVYSFQTKKHRDIYKMDKDNKDHIHIDPDRITPSNFWDGTVDWTAFEIRNPKGLKTISGAKYDGDNPSELSDSDAKSKHVKDAIQALSNIKCQLDSIISTSGVNSEEFKTLFETHFDVDNLINYQIFSDVVDNWDGFARNYQWITYDGVKWWCCPYDLDNSLGNGGVLGVGIPSKHIHYTAESYAPTYYISQRTDYNNLLENKYKSLRDACKISPEKFADMLSDWMSRFGSYYGKLENDSWGEEYNKELVVADGWLLNTDSDGNPIMGESKTYSSSTIYGIGESCFFGIKTLGFYKFTAIRSIQGVEPIVSYGFKESIFRRFKLIDELIKSCDSFYHYNKDN